MFISRTVYMTMAASIKKRNDHRVAINEDS